MKNKALIVAISEFTTLVRSKGFIIGLLLMPLFSGIAIVAANVAKNVTDTKDRRFVVIDRSGVLYEPLAAAAAKRNADILAVKPQAEPLYLPQAMSFADTDNDTRAALSDRVRREDLYAFVEIPKDALSTTSKAPLRYYSNHPAARGLPNWIGATLNAEILNRRFLEASIDRATVDKLTHRVDMTELGLLQRDKTGAVQAAAPVDKLRTVVIPLAMMMILLFAVMSTAPQLLNSIIEEKMSRISEVLIGSVTPFELMMGKLAGSIAVAVLLAVVYVGGGIYVANVFGYGDVVRLSDVGWLLLFLLLATFMFGSVFITIGAACADLKDAQGMMPPAMLLLMLPWMTWFAVLNAPDSHIALALSLIPTATPFLMLLRIMLPPGPPVWQIALSVALTFATTIAMVYAAGKVFRTGLLMQGKSATFAEMWRWVKAN